MITPHARLRLSSAFLCAFASAAVWCGCASPPGPSAQGLPHGRADRVALSMLQALVDTLVSGTPDGRRVAADSLRRMDDPRTPGIVAVYLRHPSSATRHSASRALVLLAPHAGMDGLVPALHDSSVFVRWSVAGALGAHGVQESEPALRAALSDTALAVRRAAAAALGRLADTTSVPALLAALRDPTEEVRAAAARALGHMGPASLPALCAMAEDDSGMALTAAVEALGDVGLEESVPLIGVALLDGAPPTRIAASGSLGRIGGARADSLLLAAAGDDPVGLVREAAVRALSGGEQELVINAAERRVKREPDTFVRLAWVDGLARMTDERARQILRTVADEDLSPDVRAAARAALARP